jgi:SAM-dependent methyltransferase
VALEHDRQLMGETAAFVGRQLKVTLAHPTRLRHVLSPARWRPFLRKLRRARASEVGRWVDAGDGFRRREYTSYDEYVAHQASKLKAKNLEHYDVEFEAVLAERLATLPVALAGTSVLCLAARLGTEVRAFRGHGAFAVGIDLNPGRDNRLVLPGDFHELQFADGSVGLVFSNSLDHALDLDRLLGEARRVLGDDGHLLVEAMYGAEDPQHQSDFGLWEAASWTHLDDLVDRIAGTGFRLVTRAPFTVPWSGEALLFAAATTSPGPARAR